MRPPLYGKVTSTDRSTGITGHDFMEVMLACEFGKIRIIMGADGVFDVRALPHTRYDGRLVGPTRSLAYGNLSRYKGETK